MAPCPPLTQEYGRYGNDDNLVSLVLFLLLLVLHVELVLVLILPVGLVLVLVLSFLRLLLNAVSVVVRVLFLCGSDVFTAYV